MHSVNSPLCFLIQKIQGPGKALACRILYIRAFLPCCPQPPPSLWSCKASWEPQVHHMPHTPRRTLGSANVSALGERVFVFQGPPSGQVLGGVSSFPMWVHSLGPGINT